MSLTVKAFKLTMQKVQLPVNLKHSNLKFYFFTFYPAGPFRINV